MSHVFHSGETALQAAAGSRERLAEVGPRVIREEMPEQHRTFFASLPLVVVAAADPAGQPCVGMLAGPPGFVQAPDGRHLRIAGLPVPDDPLDALLTPGARFGLHVAERRTQTQRRGAVAPSFDHGNELVDGGHMLPLTQPDATAQFVRASARAAQLV